MNLLRIATWAAMLGAVALAGPNLPAQGLAALREAISAISRRVWAGPCV